MSNVLVLVDVQNDFCDVLEGKLHVDGAMQDIKRLKKFMHSNLDAFDDIIVSLDLHNTMHIAHPEFWVLPDGSHPHPFSQVTLIDVVEGRILPFRSEEQLGYVTEYLRREKAITIWYPHCLIGSWGANIVPTIEREMRLWEKKKHKSAITVMKGLNNLSEQFSMMGGDIVGDNKIIDKYVKNPIAYKLSAYDNIYVAGEALSHCVGNTLVDYSKYASMENVHLLVDCTSTIQGFEEPTKILVDSLIEKGMKIIKSTTKL